MNGHHYSVFCLERHQYGCSRPQILRNITVKSEKSEILTNSHFKRLKFAKFEKQKRPLNHH